MTRLLLASIGFAVLQLGAPQGAGASGLRPAAESTRPVPRLETVSKPALARDEVRTDEVRPTGGAPAAAIPAALPHLPPLSAEPRAQEPARPGARSAVLLPRPRGPPA